MPCNCGGPSILWKLQKLQGLHKLSLISKSSLAAYNDHVQNTSETCGFASQFDVQEIPCYANGHNPSSARRSYSCQAVASEAVKPRASSPRPLATFASQQGTAELPASAVHHSVAATKASSAFLRTKNLFKDDLVYALELAHPSSPKIAAEHHASAKGAVLAQPSHTSCSAYPTQQHSAASSDSSASSTTSELSMADSVSSYHGYAGVNYHTGIKDIDAVPNQWGFSLNDYKAIFGDSYVQGCVPWEDQHIERSSQKKFQKLHSKRVKLLQELHTVEQDIRGLMD